MWFLNNIVSWLESGADFFHDIYLEVRGWPWPFNQIAELFYYLRFIFSSLSLGFYYFNNWVDDTNARLGKVLSYENIYSHFKSWFDAGRNAWDWVVNAFWNVTAIIGQWWSSTSLTVQVWINEGVLKVQSLIDQVDRGLASLKFDWDTFKPRLPSLDQVIGWFGNWRGNVVGHILLAGFLPAAEISKLIDSSFKDREPFWADWQDWKPKVGELFSDPEKWLLDRIESMLARFL